MQTEPNTNSPVAKSALAAAVVASLPSAGFMRLSAIIGDPEADPPIVGVFPVSKSTWWRGIREGRFPRPVKLGPNSTGWRVADIRALIEERGRAAA